MNVTQWAAWLGASTGFGNLLWNVYSKVSSARPLLRVTGYAGMVKAPSTRMDEYFLNMTVRNVGGASTTLNNISFHTYDSFWERFRKRKFKRWPTYSAVLANHEGPRYPAVIAVGAEWVGQMRQNAEFNKLLEAGDVWIAIHHSFSSRPVEVKIRGHMPPYPSSATATSA